MAKAGANAGDQAVSGSAQRLAAKLVKYVHVLSLAHGCAKQHEVTP